MMPTSLKSIYTTLKMSRETARRKVVKIVAGGTIERWETVRNALEAIPAECTHVAVHDGARPAASEELIARVFDAARVHDAVIPGDPVTSTLKRVSAETVQAEEEDAVADLILGELSDSTKIKGRRVVGTVPRERLVAIQTPQVFRADMLRRAYAQGDLAGATDDAMLVERLGAEVVLAVNVGTPVGGRETLGSIIGLTAQMINIIQ